MLPVSNLITEKKRNTVPKHGYDDGIPNMTRKDSVFVCVHIYEYKYVYVVYTIHTEFISGIAGFFRHILQLCVLCLSHLPGLTTEILHQ